MLRKEEPILAQDHEQRKANTASRLFTPEGKPIRVLSTSLGIALLANSFLIPGSAPTAGAAGEEPKLVSWSTEEVKQYFDKNVDWNIPLPPAEEESSSSSSGGSGGTGTSSSGGTTVINNYSGYGSGFGWDDLLLYHLLFNSGSNYSSRDWYGDHRGYYTGTGTQYKPRTYSSGSFQNKSTPGSVVKPRTSTSTTGSITRRSTSSKSGGIGGKSSGLSSGKSSSSRSKSSGGFFGG
ncbi:hypothetical protein DCC85_21860 [Paenibacillus sp. CAA11]|uniref:hypothetical protein n=1 Tax=Paenibacillus sp. CAA11 TaxID=1532905 RepID=UPI000D3C22B4|nr:hypothetical protein DCC85_21860 [Paenibacillus sp. CAA11]